MKELTRFPNNIIEVGGHFYWDIYALYHEVIRGLKVVAQEGIQVASIGIDTWGVDFVTIGSDAGILRNPYSYRDPHTEGIMAQYFQRVPKEKVYEKTGIQFMNFNSLFQLAAMRAHNDSALQAAEKGLKRITQAAKDLRTLASAAGVTAAPALAYGEFVSAVAPAQVVATNTEVRELVEKVYEALCDDLNTPIALSHIFDAVRIINTVKDKKLTLDASDYSALVSLFDNIVFGVLGLRDEESEGGKAIQTIDGLVNMVLEQRKAAKATKDWATSDRIRDDLKALGILIKDTKDGTEWTLE